jgi:hypothetical protein
MVNLSGCPNSDIDLFIFEIGKILFISGKCTRSTKTTKRPRKNQNKLGENKQDKTNMVNKTIPTK